MYLLLGTGYSVVGGDSSSKFPRLYRGSNALGDSHKKVFGIGGDKSTGKTELRGGGGGGGGTEKKREKR